MSDSYLFLSLVCLFQITRQSIDRLKASFKDEMDDTKWRLIIRMKKHFKIGFMLK